MAEVLNPFQGNLFERSIAPSISNRGFLELTLPHLKSSRGGSAPGAQPEAVVKLLSIFAALQKQQDEWAKNEEVQVQEYASIIKAAYNGELEEVRRHLQRNIEAIHERTQAERNALHAASTNGHLEIVQLLVEANLTINGEDVAGITPLRMAVAGNHVEVTKYLLRQKAEPNMADHTGWSPLHSAALNGRADIIKCLKTSGADVNKQTQRGYTALFLACLNGHIDCVQELVEIEAGTNELEADRFRSQLDVFDDAGFSALHCAALKGHAEITKILLQGGASPTKKSESGLVPLTLAVGEGHLSCVRELLPSTDRDDVPEAITTAVTRGHNNIFRYIMVTTDENMWSSLQNAAWKGELELIRSLIEDGREIDEDEGEQGCTPLMLAIWQGRLECAKILIEEGNANVNQPDNSGCFPLHLAIELQNEEAMKVLLEKGAQPDALNSEGKAAIHDACFKGNLNAIKLLINAGSDVDIKASKEESTCHTPLQFAALGGHIECVKLLVDKGAPIDSPGPVRCSALLAAASRNQVEVIEYLLEKDADIHVTDKNGDSVLFWAALYNNIDLLNKCLEDGQIDTNAKNSSGQTALHVASGFGHIEAVELLVHNHAEIDTKDNEECTPLQNAAECNRADVVKYLLENGADIHTKDCDGQSPLHRAASLGSIDSVKMLVERGADIVAKAEDGATPLHLAVAEFTGDRDFDFLLDLGTQYLHGPREKRNNANCVEYLLDNRADINATDTIGYTPLIFAAAKSVYDCAEILISRGADIDAKTSRESTALHIAARGGHFEILRLILSQNSQSDEQSSARLEAINLNKWTPLQEAIYNGNVECVSLLCDRGANLETSSISGKTPLYRAVEVKSVSIVELLLEKGATNINEGATYYENETPLHLAVKNGCTDIVKILVEHGAYLDSRLKTSDYNIFHLASETGQHECLQFLLDFVLGGKGGGSDEKEGDGLHSLINSTLKTGLTPLHCAILGGQLVCVKILCEYGADMEAQSLSGKTPLQRATEKKHVNIMKYLLEQHADVNKPNKTGVTALHIAASNGFAEPLGILLEFDADVNKQSQGGWTPLHMSVKARHGEIASILIAYGSNIHAELENGNTPIHIAAEWNLPEILQYLIENGVSVDSTNKMEYTALLLASSKGHPGCIEFLLQNGADVNKQSNHNSTPILLAAEYGHQSCIEKLIAHGADPTKRDKDGNSLVHVAALSGRLETLEYVIGLEGMSELISSKNNAGHLPLHGAAGKGNVDCVELLLAIGVSQEEEEESHGVWTPLHMAVKAGHVEITSILTAYGCNIHAETENGNTPIHIAAECNRKEILQYLIENGVSVDSTNKMGHTALLLASSKGHPECSDFLLQNGAEVNKQSNHNSTPLLLAAEYGHQSCVEKLVAHEADPTKRDNDGDSLVHVASLGGRLETLKYVLDLEGMSELISSKNKAGHLPLHCAARNGNLDCVEHLLKLGVSQEEGEESCSFLDEQDCQGKTPLHLAVEGGFSPVIEALIKAGGDLNIQTNDGKTCLHIVVKLWGGPENPDKKVQTTNGFEPVVSRYPEYEPLSESEQLLLYLLDKGALCTTFDANGDTPIHYTNTHRLWQLVMSRKPEEERNDLLDELDVESKRIKRTEQRVIGPEGGEIPLSRYGVHLTVPAGALDRDQDISIRLLETLPVPGIQEEEMMANFGVELKPDGLKFNHPAQIKLPHCASVVDTTDVKVVLYHFRGGELVTQEITAGNLAEIPACTVGEKDLELYIDNFCSYWLCFSKPRKGREMICLPYSNRAPVGSAYLRFYLAKDRTGVEQDLKDSATLHDAERIGDAKPFYVKWSNGDVHVAVENNKREEQATSITIAEIRVSNQTYTDFAGLKTEHYENLTMRVFQGKQTRIECKNPLEEAHETETLEKDVNGSAQKMKDDQLSKVLKKSTSGSSHGLESSSDRATGESRKQDFDDHLKTVAKKVHKDIDIDNLGKELGFEPEDIARYIKTNEKYQTITYMGSLSMLRDWRKMTKRSEENEKLKRALIAIKHQRLADDIPNDDMAIEESNDRH